MKKSLKLFIYLPLFISLANCNFKPVSNSTNTNNIIKKTVDIEDQLVKLRVEIEYRLHKDGRIDSDCRVQFIVTNIGSIPYNRFKNKTYFVFEFQTSDGKVFEIKKRMEHDISPGKSSESELVSLLTGFTAFCKSANFLRLDEDQ